VVIGIVLVPDLGVTHLASGDVMDGGKTLGCRLGLLLLRGIDAMVQFEVVLGVVTVVREERKDTGGIGDLVVGVRFGKEEVVRPIVLEVTDVGPKVLFHDRVHTFGLSVGFGCKAAERRGSILRQKHKFPEAGGELRASVGDHGFQQAVVAEDSVTEAGGQSLGRNRRMAGLPGGAAW